MGVSPPRSLMTFPTVFGRSRTSVSTAATSGMGLRPSWGGSVSIRPVPGSSVRTVGWTMV